MCSSVKRGFSNTELSLPPLICPHLDGDVYGRVAQIARFCMGSCILGRKTISYVEITRIIHIQDQETSTPLIMHMRAQPFPPGAQPLRCILAKILQSIFSYISDAGDRIRTGPGTTLRVTVFLRIVDYNIRIASQIASVLVRYIF